MKNFTLTFSILLLFVSNGFANEFLNLVHVEQWSYQEQGYIKSAAILVEPEGLYARCELIIDFGVGMASTYSGENLEVEMGFNLPPKTQITDLFLWIEDKPVQAFIFDTWTANLIYESIVQRRVDPAILVKTGPNNFNLKVYPITHQLPRQVSIHFITPIKNLTGEIQSVSLPFNILNLSQTEPERFKVAFKGNDEIESPAILESSSLKFKELEDPDFGLCQTVIIDTVKKGSNGTLIFNRKSSSSDCYLATFEQDSIGDKYFELALDYSELISFDNHRKAVFMLDFVDANCTAYDKEELLETLKYSIKNNFSAKDSFNILISGLSTNFLSDHWISADPKFIGKVLDSISSDIIRNFSNLPSLLYDGMNFLKNHGNNGSLVLLSSSNSDGDHQQANSLISGFLDYMGSDKRPVHIIDLDNLNYNYNQRHYIAGQYFMGNEYLYSRLSQMTGGEYYTLRNDALLSMITDVNGKVSGYLKSLELFIQTDGGYSFSNYQLNHTGSLLYNTDALSVIGKYIGKAPFQISVYGQSSSDEVFHFKKLVSADKIQAGGESIESAWSGNYMQELMGMEQNNQTVSHIINTSVSKRILSNYTAFLVLEPGFEIPDITERDELAVAEWDGWPTTSIEVDAFADESFSVANFPNPFTARTKISYNVAENSRITLSVFNSGGQLVEILVDEEKEAGEFSIEMDASYYEKGIYFCTLQSDGAVMAVLKLVVI